MSFEVVLITEHAPLPIHVNVLLVGQEMIAAFRFANKVVFITEIALIQILARANEDGLAMIARLPSVLKIAATENA